MYGAVANFISGKGKKPETPRRRNEFVYEYLAELRTVDRGTYIHSYSVLAAAFVRVSCGSILLTATRSMHTPYGVCTEACFPHQVVGLACGVILHHTRHSISVALGFDCYLFSLSPRARHRTLLLSQLEFSQSWNLLPSSSPRSPRTAERLHAICRHSTLGTYHPGLSSKLCSSPPRYPWQR